MTNKDLKRYSEATRRRLYDMLAESVFKGGDDLIGLTPDDIELEIVWFHHRWFGKYVWPKMKSNRIKGESRWILLRLSLNQAGQLQQDEI